MLADVYTYIYNIAYRLYEKSENKQGRRVIEYLAKHEYKQA